ncbi:MAG: protein kinase domain-containing protein [Actinomycetota bacterium]
MATTLKGRRLADRYVLETRISDGPVSTWRGRDEILGRSVAVSVVQTSGWQWDRFRRQAQATGCLSHASVLRVFDTGEEEGAAYLVTEYLEGRTLESLLENGPMQPEHALAIARAVLSAVMHAHDAGVVHGGLVPRVVLVDETGHVKVTGFGWEEDSDPRSDLAAVGTLLDAMLGNDREPSLAQFVARARGEGDRDFRDAAEMIGSLDRIPIQEPSDDADAVTPERSGDSGREPARRLVRPFTVAIIGGLLVGAFAVGLLLPSQELPVDDRARPGPPAQWPVVAVLDHDPEGDGQEQPDLTGLAIDGDASTGWKTERYETADLGGLKQGVGLLLDLGRLHDVGGVEVQTALLGWRFQLQGSEDGRTFSGPLPAPDGTVVFSATHDLVQPLEPVRVRYVLIWIVELAPAEGGFQASVNEAQILAA